MDDLKNIISELEKNTLSPREYAEFAGVSTKTIYRLMAKNELEFYRLKNIVLFPIERGES